MDTRRRMIDGQLEPTRTSHQTTKFTSSFTFHDAPLPHSTTNQVFCNHSTHWYCTPKWTCPSSSTPKRPPPSTNSHLSLELRTQIWELTVEPRTVDVHLQLDEGLQEVKNKDKKDINRSQTLWRAVHNLHSRTPVPAALQTCQESRNILQGKRECQKIERNPRCQIFNKAGTKALSEIFYATDEDVGEDEEFRGDLKLVPRYVYVNFDLDLIDIGEGRHLGTHSPVGRHNAAVKRLKFKRTDWCFVEDEYPFGKRYKTLAVVYVQCPPGNPSKWRGGVVELGWVCGPENVHLIPYSMWARRK